MEWNCRPSSHHLYDYYNTATGTHDTDILQGFGQRLQRRLLGNMLQGVMQGNGAGPAIWAFISSPIVDMIQKSGFGTFFHTCITNQVVRFVGYSFVDDTDLVQTAQDGETAAQSVMEKAVDLWEGGTRVMGGAIATGKTYWYPIEFIWQGGKWQLANTDETPYTLSVLDHNCTQTTLPTLRPDDAEETLGACVAPSGTMEAQAAKMTDKSEEWADHIR